MIAGFAFPITLSGLGQAFSAVAALLCCRVFRLVVADKPVSWRFFCTRMLPVGLFNAMTLMFGNAVYLFLSVAFIQMLKAFTPVMTMLGLFIASLEVRIAARSPYVTSIVVIRAFCHKLPRVRYLTNEACQDTHTSILMLRLELDIIIFPVTLLSCTSPK